jgi:hypothetical protein
LTRKTQPSYLLIKGELCGGKGELCGGNFFYNSLLYNKLNRQKLIAIIYYPKDNIDGYSPRL